MPEVSSGRLWSGLAGLIALVVAGQLLWAVLAWNSGGTDGMPAPVPKSPGKGAVNTSPEQGTGVTIGSRKRYFNAFPPLVKFDIDTAEDAGASIADEEYVLGVEVDGESRAYPLNMLGGRLYSEVVNDTLGGRPIAVTFCSLCEAPLVFSRRVDEKTLTFQVSGELVNSNMIINDVDTVSGWVQLLGRAVDGPLKGKQLERLPSVWTDWKTWRAGHPETTAIRLERFTEKYSPIVPGATSLKKPAFIDDLQWGLAGQGKARSWSFSQLARERVVNDSFDGRPLLIVSDPERPSPTGFDRRLDDKELTFCLRGGDLIDEATGSTWDPSSGRAIRGPLEGRRLTPVSGTIAVRSIWRKFHPDGEVWAPVDPSPEPTPKGQ